MYEIFLLTLKYNFKANKLHDLNFKLIVSRKNYYFGKNKFKQTTVYTRV